MLFGLSQGLRAFLAHVNQVLNDSQKGLSHLRRRGMLQIKVWNEARVQGVDLYYMPCTTLQ